MYKSQNLQQFEHLHIWQCEPDANGVLSVFNKEV